LRIRSGSCSREFWPCLPAKSLLYSYKRLAGDDFDFHIIFIERENLMKRTRTLHGIVTLVPGITGPNASPPHSPGLPRECKDSFVFFQKIKPSASSVRAVGLCLFVG
jgi:hypothetical protein